MRLAKAVSAGEKKKKTNNNKNCIVHQWVRLYLSNLSTVHLKSSTEATAVGAKDRAYIINLLKAHSEYWMTIGHGRSWEYAEI